MGTRATTSPCTPSTQSSGRARGLRRRPLLGRHREDCPSVGTRLGVAYHGPVEKGESRYELYRVRVVRTDEHDPARGEPDWDAIGRDAEAEASRVAPPVNDEAGADDDLPF
jgi:hypothetical protein